MIRSKTLTLCLVGCLALICSLGTSTAWQNVSNLAYWGSEAKVGFAEGSVYFVNTTTDAATAITATADTINKGVSSTSAGLKVVSGVSHLTGSTTVSTGLSSITACVGNLATDAALSANVVTTTASAGVLTIKVWKPTSSSDVTPVAASTLKPVTWTVWGS